MRNYLEDGLRLKVARLRAGLKQLDVSLAIGVGEGEISAYETGRHRPSTEIVFKICHLLKCKPEEIFADRF